MFRHVAVLAFRPETTEAERRAILDALAALPERIGTVRNYSFGLDAGVDDGNSDLVIVADFDDPTGYAHYRDHPEHRRVIAEAIAPCLARRAAVQFEL